MLFHALLFNPTGHIVDGMNREREAGIRSFGSRIQGERGPELLDYYVSMANRRSRQDDREFGAGALIVEREVGLPQRLRSGEYM